MEKKILYFLLTILSTYIIYQNINYNSQQYKKNFLMAINECNNVENICKGKTIDNIKIYGSNEQENNFYNILSNYNTEYYVIIISSFKSCSLCREQSLNIWNELYKEKKIPILLIVSEQEVLNKDDRRQIKANIKGLNIEIPLYFDNDSNLLDFLYVTPYQTPLSIILTHDKKIIGLEITSKFTKEIAMERIINFKNFFLLLNSM